MLNLSRFALIAGLAFVVGCSDDENKKIYADANAPADGSVVIVDAAAADAGSAARASEFRAANCSAVAGTLNIFWERVSPGKVCVGIEKTDGKLTLAAANRAVTLKGTSVTNEACLGTYAYQFSLSQDNLRLSGEDTFNGINMNLTRAPGEACFVGHWVDKDNTGDDFVAHISVTAFGLTP